MAKRRMLIKRLLRVDGIDYQVGVDSDYGIIHVKKKDYHAFCSVETFSPPRVRCFAVAPRGRIHDKAMEQKFWRPSKAFRTIFASVAQVYLSDKRTFRTANIILSQGMRGRTYPAFVWETKEQNVAAYIRGVIYPFKRTGDHHVGIRIPPIVTAKSRSRQTDLDWTCAYFWVSAYAACFPRRKEASVPKRRRRQAIQASLPLY